MHERENLDDKMLVKENIDKLRQIVKDKSAMPTKLMDAMKIDMTQIIFSYKCMIK